MVTKTKKGNAVYYQCETCRLFYKSNKIAKECETWCSKNKSCNLNLIKYAVKIK